MPVGNDVVDLQDPETRPGATHPRFDLRVFTDDERARLYEALRPVRLRWTLWAAKESAFKAARKLHPTVPFHPRQFAVQLLENAEEARARVVHRMAGHFDVWIEEARDWVHAVARQADIESGPPPSALSFVETAAHDAGEAGRKVRELARKAVAPLLPVEPRELTIVSEGGIPRFHLAGTALPLDLSLSHHGRIIACAWADGDTPG